MQAQMVWSAVNVSATKTNRWLQTTLDQIHHPSIHLFIDSDIVYQRSVVTFLGPLDDVLNALERLIQAATKAIDLRSHQGVHRRMGAIDVVPFVPLGVIPNLADKIYQFGTAMSAYMPVVFYAQSALKPAHIKLRDIRKKGFESLLDTMNKSAPFFDYGDPVMFEKTGCMAMGIRDQLAAFNIEVHTPHRTHLLPIAKTLRESAGGYPGLEASVFTLGPNRHHISMNLRRFDTYSIESIFEEVSGMLNARSLHVHHSELIGLMSRSMSRDQVTPLDDWVQPFKDTVKLTNFTAEKVVETWGNQ